MPREFEESHLTRIVKAARAGLSYYESPDGWWRAIAQLAKSRRSPNEPIESCIERLIKYDPDISRMDKMRRAALLDDGRKRQTRPRIHQPLPRSIHWAENRLNELSMAAAKKEGISFEQSYRALIDTPEGKDLLQKMRSARP